MSSIKNEDISIFSRKTLADMDVDRVIDIVKKQEYPFAYMDKYVYPEIRRHMYWSSFQDSVRFCKSMIEHVSNLDSFPILTVATLKADAKERLCVDAINENRKKWVALEAPDYFCFDVFINETIDDIEYWQKEKYDFKENKKYSSFASIMKEYDKLVNPSKDDIQAIIYDALMHYLDSRSFYSFCGIGLAADLLRKVIGKRKISDDADTMLSCAMDMARCKYTEFDEVLYSDD